MNFPATRQDLFAHLDTLGITHTTIEHRPVFTVEEGSDIKSRLSGGHTKNLFLRDKAGALFLICALGATPIKLNRLHKALGCARLSFGNAVLMEESLGVLPGSVTLFSLINDTQRQITLILDDALLASDPVNFHPLLNNATTTISQAHMMVFIAAWGGRVFECNFSNEIALARRLMLAI
jgi:Ala-tRNA(Pro) deacylase